MQIKQCLHRQKDFTRRLVGAWLGYCFNATFYRCTCSVVVFLLLFFWGEILFLHTIQIPVLQFIYTTRQYTHYIDIFRSGYIYVCIELIPISQVISPYFLKIGIFIFLFADY